MIERRAGLSILEVVLSVVILAAITIPLLETFSTFRRGFSKMNDYNIAIGLASSVLDHIHYSLYEENARLSELILDIGEKPDDLEEKSKEFFDSFIERNTRVTSQEPSKLSSYFVRINNLTKSGEFGITEENDENLYEQLKNYRCYVDVYYSLPEDIIDSDLDGKAEIDMAEVKVSIEWEENERKRSVELWTVYSARQHISLD